MAIAVRLKQAGATDADVDVGVDVGVDAGVGVDAYRGRVLGMGACRAGRGGDGGGFGEWLVGSYAQGHAMERT